MEGHILLQPAFFPPADADYSPLAPVGRVVDSDRVADVLVVPASEACLADGVAADLVDILGDRARPAVTCAGTSWSYTLLFAPRLKTHSTDARGSLQMMPRALSFILLLTALLCSCDAKDGEVFLRYRVDFDSSLSSSVETSMGTISRKWNLHLFRKDRERMKRLSDGRMRSSSPSTSMKTRS